MEDSTIIEGRRRLQDAQGMHAAIAIMAGWGASATFRVFRT